MPLRTGMQSVRRRLPGLGLQRGGFETSLKAGALSQTAELPLKWFQGERPLLRRVTVITRSLLQLNTLNLSSAQAIISETTEPLVFTKLKAEAWLRKRWVVGVRGRPDEIMNCCRLIPPFWNPVFTSGPTQK